MANEQAMVPYREGFNYGMGVRRATAGPLALGVTGSVTSVTDAPGGTGSFTLSQVQTTEELETHLGISAAASGGAGLFSASARFDFAKDCKVQATSLTLIISATKQRGFKQIDSPVLTQDAGNLVSEGKIDLFAERYGDVFLRGMHTGGQFFGVFRIDTKSEQSRQDISAELKGSYGVFSADVKMNMSEVCSKNKASIYASAYWEGGRVTTSITSPESLLQAFQQWTDSVTDNAVPYQATLVPYVLALGPLPPNPEDLQHQRDVLTHCARLRSQTLDKLNLVEYVTDPLHATEFDFRSAPDLAALLAGLSSDLDVIGAAASWALDHPREAMEPETFAQKQLGQAGYKLTLIPPNMPKHEGATVIVPDFRSVGSSETATQLAAGSRLTLHWVSNENVSDTFRIFDQDPAPGTQVSPGATVTLTTNTSKWVFYATNSTYEAILAAAH